MTWRREGIEVEILGPSAWRRESIEVETLGPLQAHPKGAADTGAPLLVFLLPLAALGLAVVLRRARDRRSGRRWQGSKAATPRSATTWDKAHKDVRRRTRAPRKRWVNGMVYEWTDKRTGLRYIGSHCSRRDPRTDGYTGSGEAFRRAYEQRPQDFTRRILWYMPNTTMLETRQVEQGYLNRVPRSKLYSGRWPAFYNLTNKVDMKGC